MAWVCAYLMFGTAGFAQGGKPRPHVLVVHSYHQGMKWTDDITASLKQQLHSEGELFIHYLDVKRFPSREREAERLQDLRRTAVLSKPDVIVSIDDYAFMAVLTHLRPLFPETPIVFGGLNSPPNPRPARVTGVVEAFDVAGTLRLAFALQPELERVVVVNDRTETGVSNEASMSGALQDLGGRQLLRLGQGSFQETEQALSALDPGRDMVLLMSWNLDKLGVARSYEEAISRASACSTSAIYGIWDFYLGRGLLGGSLLDGQSHGQEVAKLTTLVLSGIQADAIPVEATRRGRPVVDYHELEHHALAERKVPQGVLVLNKPRSLWSEHLVLIISIIAVVVVQGLSIAWLVVVLRQRRKVEKRLYSSREHLRLTLDSSSDAIITTDASGLVIHVNPEAERLMEWSASQAVGLPLERVFELHPENTEERLNPPLSQSVLQDGKSFAVVYSCLWLRSGTRRHVSFSASSIRDVTGQVCGLVLTVRDITRHRQIEEQLRHSQKIESIGLLAGGVAHDFNNILQVINGNLAMLLEEPDLTEAHKVYLDEIHAAATRAGDLTRQLLAFGRRQRLEAVQVDCAVLVQGMLRMVQRLIGASIELSCEAAPERFWVKADKGQLEQVILNLCLNARDAMPKGGRISIELNEREIEDGDLDQFQGLKAGRYVELVLSDTGLGMDRETQHRIFEPFFTTKKAGEGTGLGLSVVQGIVQQHAGLIKVYSEPGKGTAFHLFFPALAEARVPGAPAVAVRPDVVQETSSIQGKRILLVDDDASVRQSIHHILERSGFDVIAATNGVEACKAVEASGSEFAVVVMDVVMPQMDGLDAAQEIGRLRPQLPIVLCSGFPGSMKNRTALAPNCRWLTKPFPAEELLVLLRDILRAEVR